MSFSSHDHKNLVSRSHIAKTGFWDMSPLDMPAFSLLASRYAKSAAVIAAVVWALALLMDSLRPLYMSG